MVLPPPLPPMPHRIFLVEDHPVVRDAYVSVLTREPDLSVCGEASTAEEALDHIVDGACDLVVTDIRLPGMSGIELVERLHRERPGLPSLVITGHEETAFERQAQEAGAAAFLPKSKAARFLVSTIRSVLHGTGKTPANGSTGAA